MSSAIDSVRSGGISKSSTEQAARELDSATKTFTDTVKSLGKPNTAVGTHARYLSPQERLHQSRSPGIIYLAAIIVPRIRG